MRIMIVMMLVLVLAMVAAPVRADNIVDSFSAFVSGLTQPEAGGLMLLHGREATGTGPVVSWQIDGLPAYIDLGIVQSNQGSTRFVPGASLQIARGKGTAVRVGLAATPNEYGGIRIGGAKLANVGAYLMLGYTF